VTTSSSTSTVSGAGTITAYTPGSDYITFRTETDMAPVKYYYTKKTVLVDADGRTVEWSAPASRSAGSLRIREGWRSHGRFQSGRDEAARDLREKRNHDDHDDYSLTKVRVVIVD